MFKTKEDLIDENKLGTEESNDIIYGINQSFKSFTERVEFYKRWYDDQLDFSIEYPEIYDEYDKNINRFKADGILFSDWLFDYCFGDIINEE